MKRSTQGGRYFKKHLYIPINNVAGGVLRMYVSYGRGYMVLNCTRWEMKERNKCLSYLVKRPSVNSLNIHMNR